jgi:hypothetical protein
MSKIARIWDGTAWVDLATSVPDLSNYQLKSEGGLTFVKKQTIGTAVSSVTVTDAFSATYENYLITINGGVGSTTAVLRLQIGNATTPYYSSGIVVANDTGSTSTVINTGASFTQAGTFTTGLISSRVELQNPFLAKPTVYASDYVTLTAGGSSGRIQGFLNTTTSYSDFTFSTTSGTLTGGTIYVYGYNKG